MKQVDVPTLTGSFGILASHVPTLQVLRPGVVTVHAEDGTATKYFGERGRRSWGGKACVGMVFLVLSQGRLCPSSCGLVHFQGFLLSQPARGCWKLILGAVGCWGQVLVLLRLSGTFSRLPWGGN